MRRTLKMVGVGLVMAAALVARPAAASAQVVQSLNLNLGVFMPRGRPGRRRRLAQGRSVYRMEDKDSRGRVSGEGNFEFGNRVELGLGGAFYQRTVPTSYRDFTNADGSEVRSDFKLRTTPISGIVRVLPFGTASTFQPYIGGGIGVINWRYSEVGDFIDFNNNNNVYHAQYTADGNTTAPIFLAGFRAPLNSDVWALTVEGRYVRAQADLNTNDFHGSKIDLGGTSLRCGVLVRL